ncbi:peptidoglycan-binding domain-containing protein [Streptomyces sp. CMB-StM0423]|uniref:peptidoglycan-binding domain-containing protein n=1 Tax=Streptomyces sp. CMB-StM0423 TaxID=2059884 RepID=UPI000C7025EE|nr:peptidoglycan-binding domain-containing protein [Streptomyces sp. CMB-StM0423]AUH39100.1 hypothetical protein CXR04_01490 [Streptomyces sp. CMB-StM0423]
MFGRGGRRRGGRGCARGADRYGRAIRWREAADGGTPASFRWEEFLVAGDPDLSSEGAFAAPKGLRFGADGTLWISTGISGHDLNGIAAVHEAAGSNALPAADPTTGKVRNVEIDGIFGRSTETATRDAQSRCGVGVDGIIGSGTWRCLHNFDQQPP